MSLTPADASPPTLAAIWPEDALPARLDKACAASFPGISRSRLKALIEDGRVSIDGGTLTDPSAKVKPGQGLSVAPPPPVPAEPQPEDIPLSIVYEDADLLVLDKPPGLVVHPAAGNAAGTLVNALLAHCGDGLSGIGGVKRPGIVHRIDKDTSGLMVVAKSDAAHAGLAAQFAAHTLDRAYTALVWGWVAAEAGEIEGNIGRNPKDRKKMAVVKGGGKTALTRYRVLERFGRLATLVECRLATGRTHQIRVHFAQCDHSLVGDPLYGRAPRHGMRNFPDNLKGFIDQFPRQALHAHRIGFNHPISNDFLSFEAPLPNDMQALIAAFREAAKINT
ncbi:RluA family pseudouridine synthase [Oleispirillum naphthae]|uniref:RluA family pseudouridine synthase n=1 Tax=Oleispirillum naphthae TaxID=2838853 RepID=UPI0030823C41